MKEDDFENATTNAAGSVPKSAPYDSVKSTDALIAEVDLASEDEIIEAPTMLNPIEIIFLLVDKELGLTILMNSVLFAAMFTSLTILPVYLAT